MKKNNWNDFNKIKPDKDKLFVITNGNGYFEICYFEDNELVKPFRFDEYDLPAFNSEDNNLKWMYIEYP